MHDDGGGVCIVILASPTPTLRLQCYLKQVGLLLGALATRTDALEPRMQNPAAPHTPLPCICLSLLIAGHA
jgi:hypothetical protein